MDGSHHYYQQHDVLVVSRLPYIDHALNSPTRGFPIIRHNEVRDLTADLMSGVCHDVCVEPALQPLTGEHLSLATANREDSARLDVRACGFW